MREYIELHPHAGSPVIRRIGSTIVRDDDEAPIFSEASGITVVEITGRTDGPFPQGNLYNTSTDAVLPAPTPPAPDPPTRAEELKALGTWTATDRNEALEIFLRSNI